MTYLCLANPSGHNPAEQVKLSVVRESIAGSWKVPLPTSSVICGAGRSNQLLPAVSGAALRASRACRRASLGGAVSYTHNIMF